MRSKSGFTLIELMVVISIIALLISLLTPALGKVRQYAICKNCLTNMRNMEIAHWAYMTDNQDRLIKVGLAHGGVHADEEVAWINTLQDYYGSQLLARSPADDSPHWGPYPAGEPISGASEQQRRRTSYGINNYLDDTTCPDPIYGPYLKLNKVRLPSRTVHFVYMAETGEFAGADHPHVENWVGNIPVQAAKHLEINAHGGPPQSWQSVTNYGFLDGHAETLPFASVFAQDSSWNLFDPRQAR